MRYWTRELAGWLLILIGLYFLYACMGWLLDPHYVLEGGVLAVVGIMVFRGGLQLLKVAMAARVCMEAQEKITTAEPKKTESRPLGQRPRRPLVGPPSSRE